MNFSVIPFGSLPAPIRDLINAGSTTANQLRGYLAESKYSPAVKKSASYHFNKKRGLK
jgi:hypothetical protein